MAHYIFSLTTLSLQVSCLKECVDHYVTIQVPFNIICYGPLVTRLPRARHVIRHYKK